MRSAVTAFAAIASFAALATGCTSDVDEQWQLDHDRIIAVRATPPRIQPGETSEVDLLIGVKGGHPFEAAPELATVISPQSLASTLAPAAGKWVVTAPSAAQLAAARTELGLAVDAPVPLVVGTSYAGQTLLATKTVYLGETLANPSLDSLLVDGAAAPTTRTMSIGILVDVPLSVTVADENLDIVNWLTSCGTMHDFDLPRGYLRVEKDDPTTGDLAVVVRGSKGGVAWRVWPISAQ